MLTTKVAGPKHYPSLEDGAPASWTLKKVAVGAGATGEFGLILLLDTFTPILGKFGLAALKAKTSAGT